MCGPTDEQSSAKGALVSASRKRQVLRVWQDAASADAKAFGFAKERLLLFGGYRPRIIEEKARIRRPSAIASPRSESGTAVRRLAVKIGFCHSWRRESNSSALLIFSPNRIVDVLNPGWQLRCCASPA